MRKQSPGASYSLIRFLNKEQSNVKVSYSPPSPQICDPYSEFYPKSAGLWARDVSHKNRTSSTSVGCISVSVFPKCFSVRPIPATFIIMATKPASIISCKSSSCSLCHKYARTVKPSRWHLKESE